MSLADDFILLFQLYMLVDFVGVLVWALELFVG